MTERFVILSGANYKALFSSVFAKLKLTYLIISVYNTRQNSDSNGERKGKNRSYNQSSSLSHYTILVQVILALAKASLNGGL